MGAAAVTLVLWASAFAGIRAALAGPGLAGPLAYSPGQLAVFRFLVASAVLAVVAVATRLKLPKLRDLPTIALAGFLGITVYHVALNYGEIKVSAARRA